MLEGKHPLAVSEVRQESRFISFLAKESYGNKLIQDEVLGFTRILVSSR